VDLYDLHGQASGYLPARVTLLGNNHEALDSSGLAVDVRGSALSLYGVFGITMALVTLVVLGMLLIGLARQQLPANRWNRSLRFLVPGVGIGITLTFTLSAFRVATPNPMLWLALIVGCGLVAFALGYLSPAPDTVEEDQDLPTPGADVGYADPSLPPRPDPAPRVAAPRTPADQERLGRGTLPPATPPTPPWS
jgi:hypothetical protein